VGQANWLGHGTRFGRLGCRGGRIVGCRCGATTLYAAANPTGPGRVDDKMRITRNDPVRGGRAGGSAGGRLLPPPTVGLGEGTAEWASRATTPHTVRMGEAGRGAGGGGWPARGPAMTAKAGLANGRFA